jgi:hypothetical protein
MNNRKFTTAPVEARQSIDAEWWRLPAVERFTGLKRGHVYELIKSGAIRSVVLRRPGAKTGVRLVHAESLRGYLNGILEIGGATRCGN